MGDEKPKLYVNVLFDQKLLSRVDDFRFKHRFTSRTEALRWLIKAALDSKVTPKSGGE